jgi:hypothetical protein
MKMQLLTGYINLGGSRDHVSYRGADDPMTYPETLVLQVIHGTEHVHTLVEIGEVERDPGEELERLAVTYPRGGVRTLFPAVGGRVALPGRDDNLPTVDEVRAAETAAAEATAKARAKRATKPAAKPTVPPIESLPEG